MVETCLKDVTFGNVSRKFIWIHVQVYIIFLQCVCVVYACCLCDNLKCLIRVENFPLFSLRLKGQAYIWTRNISHERISFTDVTNILICNRTFFASHLFFSRFRSYGDHTKNIITIMSHHAEKNKRTHTRTWYFSRTYILLLFCLCMMCCCCCYCWLCNVCSFAIFFYLLLQTIIANDHIWRITKHNFVQYNNIAYDTVWKALLGHKTRIVQCCSCSCCFFFITFTSIKLFKMIERTENI